MSLKFKDSTGTIHSMSGGGGGVSASQIEALYPLLAKLYIDQEGDLIFGSHKVNISDDLSTNDQAITDMVNDENSGHGDDYVPDETDEAINNMFNNDTPSGNPDENEFDDLFNGEDDESESDSNEFDDLFNSTNEGGDAESEDDTNEFDDLFNNNSESDANDDEINSWFGDNSEGGDDADDTNEFDNLFGNDDTGSNSDSGESNEFDNLFGDDSSNDSGSDDSGSNEFDDLFNS